MTNTKGRTSRPGARGGDKQSRTSVKKPAVVGDRSQVFGSKHSEGIGA